MLSPSLVSTICVNEDGNKTISPVFTVNHQEVELNKL
jgi:hypothetical protein